MTFAAWVVVAFTVGVLAFALGQTHARLDAKSKALTQALARHIAFLEQLQVAQREHERDRAAYRAQRRIAVAAQRAQAVAAKVERANAVKQLVEALDERPRVRREAIWRRDVNGRVSDLRTDATRAPAVPDAPMIDSNRADPENPDE